MNIEEIMRMHNHEENRKSQFSGTILYATGNETHYVNSYGYANRSDRIKNTSTTRFGVASGCKIFTAIAICQLVEKGLLDFNTRVVDLGINLNQFDSNITVHHLLTHTSGIPDYCDEEFTTDYERLWNTVPMYNITSPKCFLPLFQNNPMKFQPGTRFSYSNSGFIVLGIIVEKLTGLNFINYVQDYIFKVCDMDDSGYFRMDQLPERTAIGYVGNDDNWRTNIYSIPVVGGPDGGAYSTVYDLHKFWNALLSYRLLSEKITKMMLFPHVQDNEYTHYGYGVWMTIINGEIFKYFVMGGDPGVVMLSSYYPKINAGVHVLSNVDEGAGVIASRIDEMLLNN